MGARVHLTDDQVREIKQRYWEEDISYRQLAEDYRCGATTIGQIIRGERRESIDPGCAVKQERLSVKLNEALVRSIREEYQERNVTLAQLACRYDVSRSTIYNVVSRKLWRWVD